ncbi:MAG: ROK family protein, partial [bacterium]
MKEYIAGIDVGGTKINVAVADTAGTIIFRRKTPTNVKTATLSPADMIADSLKTICADKNILPEHIKVISLAMPGPVDHKRCVVHKCPNIPGLIETDMEKPFHPYFNADVIIENDARAAGFAEAVSGAGKNFDHVFFATVSTGIGGALIINGKIYHGGAGAAGELGQTLLSDGTVFESAVSGPSLERKFSITPEDIPEKVHAGDITALKALDYLVENLGVLLGNVTTLLSPDVIVIGGGLSNLGEIFL